MKRMRVWQARHQDGSPWKNWAAVIEGGKLITRWGAANRPMSNQDEVSLKGATPSAKLAKMEADKRAKGYVYLGELNVAADGEIDFSANASPAPKPIASAFYTVRAPVPDSKLRSLLQQAGMAFATTSTGVKIETTKGEVLLQGSIDLKDKLISIAGKKGGIQPLGVLAMAFLAKHQGTLLAPGGIPIKTTFDALCAEFGANEMHMELDAAETLGLRNKPLAKLVKSTTGLFDF